MKLPARLAMRTKAGTFYWSGHAWVRSEGSAQVFPSPKHADQERHGRGFKGTRVAIEEVRA